MKQRESVRESLSLKKLQSKALQLAELIRIHEKNRLDDIFELQKQRIYWKICCLVNEKRTFEVHEIYPLTCKLTYSLKMGAWSIMNVDISHVAVVCHFKSIRPAIILKIANEEYEIYGFSYDLYKGIVRKM